MPEDEARHDWFHQNYMHGPEANLPDGTHFITHASAHDLRGIAEASVEMGRKDTPFDHPFFTAEDSPSGVTVALYVLNHHAVGGIVTAKRICDRRGRLVDFRTNQFMPTIFKPTTFWNVERRARVTIEFLWLAKARRGQGLFKRILRYLEEHEGISRDEFALAVPFTGAALKLWSRIGPLEVFFVLPNDAVA